MKPRTVICPHCGTPVVWNTTNRWRPFCSERCKMIDLGAWANEGYRIPAVEHDDVPDTGDADENPTLN